MILSISDGLLLAIRGLDPFLDGTVNVLAIAGYAHGQGLTLVANNTPEFECIGGLRTENRAGREPRRS